MIIKHQDKKENIGNKHNNFLAEYVLKKNLERYVYF